MLRLTGCAEPQTVSSYIIPTSSVTTIIGCTRTMPTERVMGIHCILPENGMVCQTMSMDTFMYGSSTVLMSLMMLIFSKVCLSVYFLCPYQQRKSFRKRATFISVLAMYVCVFFLIPRHISQTKCKLDHCKDVCTVVFN